MAIEYKRMTQRYSDNYATYETNMSTILPFEFVSVLQGSPDTADGAALYYKYSANTNPKLLVDSDKLNKAITGLRGDMSFLLDTVQSWFNEALASTKAELKRDIANVSKGEVSNVSSKNYLIVTGIESSNLGNAAKL